MPETNRSDLIVGVVSWVLRWLPDSEAGDMDFAAALAANPQVQFSYRDPRTFINVVAAVRDEMRNER